MFNLFNLHKFGHGYAWLCMATKLGLAQLGSGCPEPSRTTTFRGGQRALRPSRCNAATARAGRCHTWLGVFTARCWVRTWWIREIQFLRNHEKKLKGPARYGRNHQLWSIKCIMIIHDLGLLTFVFNWEFFFNAGQLGGHQSPAIVNIHKLLLTTNTIWVCNYHFCWTRIELFPIYSTISNQSVAVLRFVICQTYFCGFMV